MERHLIIVGDVYTGTVTQETFKVLDIMPDRYKPQQADVKLAGSSSNRPIYVSKNYIQYMLSCGGLEL